MSFLGLAKWRLQAEPWEHQNLRGDRQRVAHGDIGDSLDHGHAARLRHARFLDRRAGFCASFSSAMRLAIHPVAISHRRTATSQ